MQNYLFCCFEHNNKDEIRSNLILILDLWYIQQFKFLLPPSLDARHHLSLIASERDILLVDIPVAGFQFLNQPAFRHLPVPD